MIDSKIAICYNYKWQAAFAVKRIGVKFGMEPNRKNTARAILIIFSSILFYTVLQNLEAVRGVLSSVGRILSPVFIGAAIAFIVNIPMRLLEENVFSLIIKRHPGAVKARRPVCLLLSILIILGLFALIIGLIAPEFAATVMGIAQSLPSQANDLIARADELIRRLNLPLDDINLFEKIDWNSVSRTIMAGLSNTGAMLSKTIGVTSNVLSGLFNFVIGFVLSIYILASKEKLCRQGARLLRVILPEAVCDKIFRVLAMSSGVFTRFISGQCIEALILGALCYVGMLIFRMPYALMISALISVTALIPVFGAFIGTSVGALMILFVSPIKAFGFVLFIIILQQIESNVIYPRVVGSSVGLPGIWVLLSVTLFGSIFGAVGLLLGVPFCAVLYCLVRDFVRKRESEE